MPPSGGRQSGFFWPSAPFSMTAAFAAPGNRPVDRRISQRRIRTSDQAHCPRTLKNVSATAARREIKLPFVPRSPRTAAKGRPGWVGRRLTALVEPFFSLPCDTATRSLVGR